MEVVFNSRFSSQALGIRNGGGGEELVSIRVSGLRCGWGGGGGGGQP